MAVLIVSVQRHASEDPLGYIATFYKSYDLSIQIDLEDEDEKWPHLAKLSFKDCILHPGEMLYIPPKYWHFVKALDVSFSISFWWR